MNKWIVFFLLILNTGCMGASSKYTGPAMSVRLNERKEAFGKEIAEKYDLELLVHGLGDIVDSHTTRWAISWASEKKLELPEARKFLIPILDDFWKEISTNEAYQDVADYLHKTYPRTSVREIVPENIGIKISFWDKNVNRYPKPYLSQIKVADGKVYYYYADPVTHDLTDPIVETIEEAKKR